jgi:hypothetical protein
VGYSGGQPTVNESLVITAEFRNSGKTPAKNVTAVINAVPAPPDFNLPARLAQDEVFFTVKGPVSHDLVFPNSGFSLSRTIDQTSIAAYAKARGKVTVYVWGRVTYDDVFKRHHWFTFCGVTDSEREGYGPCEAGNHADEE